MTDRKVTDNNSNIKNNIIHQIIKYYCFHKLTNYIQKTNHCDGMSSNGDNTRRINNNKYNISHTSLRCRTGIFTLGHC